MNFTELQDRLKFVLNNNDTQTDADFTAARIKQAINYAYNDEIQQAETEGSRRYFKATQDITWPSGQLTYDLAPTFDKRGLIRVSDITNTNPGYSIVFDEKGFAGDVFWKDSHTLQWGTAGPGSAKTLRIEYFAVAEHLAADDDVPQLVPPQFHWLLVWASAVFLKDVADEQAPASWHAQLHRWRGDFYKYLSRGRPMDDLAQASNTYPDSDVGFVY